MKIINLVLIIILATLLRVWNLSGHPAGFNADEAAIGYNAYSLLTTGKDEYGTAFPLIFKSFGDYKPGLYFYLVLPFVATLGLNELAVRLPSALMGIGTVILVYFLGKKVFNHWAGTVAAFLLAITPWHIHFSRGGWETNAATFFVTLGVLLLIKSFDDLKYLFLSQIAFLASMYSYQSPRLIIPIFMIFYLIFYKKIREELLLKKFKKKLLISFLILFIISVPLILQFVSGEGGARFSGLSFLSDPGPVLRVNELRGEHGNLEGVLPRILHNKLTAYFPSFLNHYLDHFTPSFLFINGDPIERNKVVDTGQLFLVETFFLTAAIWHLFRKKVEHAKLIFLWILISPLASSMTYQTPHALRALNMVIPLTIFAGFGLYCLVISVKKYLRYLLILVVFLALFYEFVRYWESYTIHTPKRYPSAWEYGFKEMISRLTIYENNYKKVVITDRYDQPYILVLFYKKYDPQKYQPQAHLSPRDRFHFGTIRGFDKYEFRKINKDEIKEGNKTLYIGTKDEFSENIKIIDQVNFLNGKPAFIFVGT